MKRTRMPAPRQRREGGLVLLCVLMLMLVAMLAGVAVARTTFASVAAARYERERLVARGAAEAALLDAERDIETSGDSAGAATSARTAWFAAGAPAWPDGCGQGEQDRGLCAARDPPAWQTLDLAAPGNPALAPYGELTGAPMAAGRGLLPARRPAYLIERLDAAGPAGTCVYRITAIGFGARDSVQVVLQALYRKHGPAAPAAPPGALPAGRIGWREIVNWPELHARAAP